MHNHALLTPNKHTSTSALEHPSCEEKEKKESTLLQVLFEFHPLKGDKRVAPLLKSPVEVSQ